MHTEFRFYSTEQRNDHHAPSVLEMTQCHSFFKNLMKKI